jgi:peptidoglycan/xylan/chitin deacetylase (PgdA/CDA1 family)
MRNYWINLGFILANLGMFAFMLYPAISAVLVPVASAEGKLSPTASESYAVPLAGGEDELLKFPEATEEAAPNLTPASEAGESAGLPEEAEPNPPEEDVEPEPPVKDAEPEPPVKDANPKLPGKDGGRVYYRLPTSDKVVALTFDDGPGRLTNTLLAILSAKKVPATFFLLGNSALNNPGLVEAITNAGCDLANHTWSHPSLTKLKEEKIYWQTEACAAVFAGLEAECLPFLRPPYGRWNEKVKAVCRRLNYHIILWNVDSRDWEGGSAEEVLAKVLDGLKPGSIVLFHEGKDVTLEVLPKFIDEARARGYEFVRLTDYIELP